MHRNPLRDQAALSSRKPDDVLARGGSGGDFVLAVALLLILAVIVALILFAGAGGGSPSPSPSLLPSVHPL
jgi:hypothetical protein